MQVDKGEVLARGGAEEVAGWDVVHAQENVTFRCEGDVTHKPPPRLEMEIWSADSPSQHQSNPPTHTHTHVRKNLRNVICAPG